MIATDTVTKILHAQKTQGLPHSLNELGKQSQTDAGIENGKFSVSPVL